MAKKSKLTQVPPTPHRPLFLPKSLPPGYSNWQEWYSQNPNPPTLPVKSTSPKAGEEIDMNRIYHRQTGKETGMFNPLVVKGLTKSSKGALGMAQAMPAALAEYKKKFKEDIDVTIPENSVKFQKWMMGDLMGRNWINHPSNESDTVKVAKALAAYNYGPTNVINTLNKAKQKGIDIYSNKLEWLKELPEETSDYVNKILLAKDPKFEKEYAEVKDKYWDLYSPNVPIKEDGGLVDIIKGSYVNPFNWGVPDYSNVKNFNKAYEQAKKAGEEEFLWGNKRYSTKYAGTPRQEVGAYGVQGKPVNTKYINDPAQVNLYPPSSKYPPGHIAASIGDNQTSVDYSRAGNYPYGLRQVKNADGKSFNIYGQDNLTFSNKVVSLPTGKYGIEEEYTPSTWNLFTNNCADNVCDAFGIPRNKGIQTPFGAMQKIQKKYPTLNVTGRTYEDYYDLAEKTRNIANMGTPAERKKLLANYNNLVGIASSPDLQSTEVSRNFGTALQVALSKEGYNLPNSIKSNDNFDGVIGPETLSALKDWQSKNAVSKKEDGGPIYNTGISSVSTQKTFQDNGNYANTFESSIADNDGFRQYYKQTTPGSLIHYAGDPATGEQVSVNNQLITDPFLKNFLYTKAGYQTGMKKDGGPVYNWIPPNYPRVGARNKQGGWLDKYEYGGDVKKYARKGEIYNERRADELGYIPDAAGHLPSVDYETSEWLKSAQHPTAWKEYLYGYTLNPAVSTGYNLGFDFGGYFGKNQLKYYPKKEDGSWVTNSSIPTPTTPSYYPAGPDRTLTNYQMGTPKAPMYAAGSTVWTKQTTPTWVAGTPTPTTTQREINPSRTHSPGTAVPYPEIKITGPTNPYMPASPPVLQDNPYKGPMRLHAPDTRRMAYGGYVPAYKKGGFLSTLGDIGLGIVDSSLSSVGSVTGIKSMQDMIDEDQYANDKFDDVANFTGKIAGTALKVIPVTAPFAAAAGAVGTVANRALKIDEKNYDPSKHTSAWDKWGSGIETVGSIASMAMGNMSGAAGAANTLSKAAQTANTITKGANLVNAGMSLTQGLGQGQVDMGSIMNIASSLQGLQGNSGLNKTSNLGGVGDINVGATDIMFARDGGDVPPLYVSDPNASELLAYRDSVNANRISEQYGAMFRKNPYDPRIMEEYGKKMDAVTKRLGLKPDRVLQGYDASSVREIPVRGRSLQEFWQGETPVIALFKKPVREVIYNPRPNVTKLPMRGMPSVNVERTPKKVNVPKTNPLPTQYMDTRGEFSNVPQVPPVYTEEQLLKMGYRAPQKKANGGWLDSYEEGGETTSLVNQALNENRPQASSTFTGVPLVAQALDKAFNKEQDLARLSDEEFMAKYNEGKHKYQYNSNPQYRAEVDKSIRAAEKLGQPMIKQKVEVNPNMMFMVPSRGYTPETAQALVDANLETIGTALPVPGLEAVGKIPSLLSIASKAVAPIKASIKEGAGIYRDYYQLNKLFNQQDNLQTQLNKLYHPLQGDETSPFMQTRLAEYHLKRKYDAYQARKYPYISSTFGGSPKEVLSSSTMPAFGDLDKAIEARSKQLLEEQKLQGMGATATKGIITYRTPTPLVYATKHGKSSMINLKTGEAVPVSVEPAGETINFFKTGEVAVNDYKPSFINPNLKNTLKDNIDWVENASGGKVFGSARGVADVNLPHLPNDLEVLITRDDYNTKVAGKIGKVSNEGKAITHSLDNNAGNFDFVIIDADNKGFATGDRAAELFRQFDPDGYFEASRKALKEGKPMTIPYTPKQLLDKVDPKVKTVMDAMEIDATSTIKQKHVNRPDAYIAYGDPAIVEEAQTKFIQALVGKKGKVAPTFNPAEFSNPEKNLRILEEIGFKGDAQAIIKDPKRMQLAINDYYINTTVLSRGVRKVNFNTGKELTLEEVEQAFKVWDPEAGGGMMRGAGQNHVVLGKSGEYDFYGHKQIGLDLPTNNVENFITSLKKQTDGLGKLSDEERNVAKDILAAYVDNDRYKNIIPATADDFINAVAGGVPNNKMKEALAKFSEATGKKVTITSDYGSSLYASTLKDFDETLDALEFNVSNQVPIPTSRTSRQYAMADPNSFSVNPATVALNRRTQDQFKLLYNKINDGVNKTSERLERLKATRKNLQDALFNPEKEKARIKAVSRARNKEIYEQLDKVEAEIVERTKTLDALTSRITKAQKYNNVILLSSVGISAAIAMPIFDKASDAFSEWQQQVEDRHTERIKELKARRNKKGLQNPPNKSTSNTNSRWLNTLQIK